MPIKGLSDRGLGLPEIGQIRKGAPKGKDRPGQDLDYFRVEFDAQEVEAAEVFKKIYGDKPKEIRIVLLFNEVERNWDSWLEAYTAGRMVARADGEFYTYLVDTKTGEVVVRNGVDKDGKRVRYVPDMPVGYDYQKNPVYAKPVGRLKVIIPELARAATMTVLTTSVNDIANLTAQINSFKELNAGLIAGIPFILKRRPHMISRPDPKDKSKRIRSEKWMLSIEADPVWVKAKLLQVKRLALPGNGLTEHDDTVDATLVEEYDEWEPPAIPAKVPKEPAEEKVVVQQPPEPPPDFVEEHAAKTVVKQYTMEEVQAMEMSASDGKKYGTYTIDELEKKLKSIDVLIQKGVETKQQDLLLQHIDAIMLVKKLREAELASVHV